jgi:serine/threonine protein kinase
MLQSPPADIGRIVAQAGSVLDGVRQIGAYQLLALVGAGGMGEVYRARDTKLGRDVAGKLLSATVANAAGRRRFQREAQTASSLNHPHILTVHDAGEAVGRQYLVTELIDGGTLRDWAHTEKYTWRSIVELLIGVADGLATAHAAGILHRDIKPENILVTRVLHGPAVMITPPRRLAEGDMAWPHFTNDGVVFRLTEGNVNYLFRMSTDGSDLRKAVPYPIARSRPRLRMDGGLRRWRAAPAFSYRRKWEPHPPLCGRVPRAVGPADKVLHVTLDLPSRDRPGGARDSARPRRIATSVSAASTLRQSAREDSS